MKTFHVSEQDLLRAADGELSSRRMAKVHSHLAACWTCRARMQQIESTIVDFVQTHQHSLDPQLPLADAPRRLLQARLAQLAASTEPGRWRNFLAFRITRRGLVFAGLALALAIATMLSLRIASRPGQIAAQRAEHVVPDPSLTPGMAQPLTRADLCSMGNQNRAPAIPRPVALKVFAAYGVNDPSPREYELDYLIAPELGGTNDIRNLWPQPYWTASWDAHAKDALEDYLYRRVCEGDLDLATAQRDIATDWIAAYKKYFRTQQPLPTHAAFLKDQPWQ